MSENIIDGLLPTEEELIEDGDMDEDEMDEGLAEHEARAQRDAEGLVESNIVAK